MMGAMDRLQKIKRELSDRDVDIEQLRRKSKSDWASGVDEDRLYDDRL